ncbi:MAG: ATP-binding protein/SpoIIE family protein phosphatase [Caulobacteraceae bacterium]|nr:ATP-binding protein/SpoIIE family protein phosphatase [Caulobacteraceae bacterium]
MPVGTIRTYSFTVRDYTDLRIAVSNVQKLPFVASASDLERSMIGTIVSELGSNIIKYATYGTIIASMFDECGQQGVEIIAKDDGPGIENLDLALRDSFSTGQTLGLGLPGVKRMADRFSIRSTPSSGTVVSAVKILKSTGLTAKLTLDAPRIFDGSSLPIAQHCEIGTHSRPRVGEINSGDRVVIAESDSQTLIVIIDVTGHGDRAHASAKLIQSIVETNSTRDPKALMALLHTELQGTPGAAIGILKIDKHSNRFSYLAVGNTGASRIKGKKWRGISKDGVLGQRLPTLLEQTDLLDPGDVIFLWTDGLPETTTPQFIQRHVDEAAAPLAPRSVTPLGRDHADAGCARLKWFA